MSDQIRTKTPFIVSLWDILSYFWLKYSYFSTGTKPTQNCGFVSITENLYVCDWGWFFFFTLGVGISRPLQIIYSLWRLLDLWPGALYLMGWGNNCIIAYENSFASTIIDQSIQSAYLRWNNKSCESSILATLQNSHSNNIVTRSRRFYLRKTQCLITSVQMRCTQYEFFSSLEYQEISSNHYFTKKKK